EARCAAADATVLAREWTAVRSVAFGPDGKRLAFVAGEQLVCMDVDEKAERFRRRGSDGKSMVSVSFSPDSDTRWIATASELESLSSENSGGEINLWDAHTGEKKWTASGHTFAAFSADGNMVATGGTGKTILLLGCDTGRVRARL